MDINKSNDFNEIVKINYSNYSQIKNNATNYISSNESKFTNHFKNKNKDKSYSQKRVFNAISELSEKRDDKEENTSNNNIAITNANINVESKDQRLILDKLIINQDNDNNQKELNMSSYKNTILGTMSSKIDKINFNSKDNLINSKVTLETKDSHDIKELNEQKIIDSNQRIEKLIKILNFILDTNNIHSVKLDSLDTNMSETRLIDITNKDILDKFYKEIHNKAISSLEKNNSNIINSNMYDFSKNNIIINNYENIEQLITDLLYVNRSTSYHKICLLDKLSKDKSSNNEKAYFFYNNNIVKYMPYYFSVKWNNFRSPLIREFIKIFKRILNKNEFELIELPNDMTYKSSFNRTFSKEIKFYSQILKSKLLFEILFQYFRLCKIDNQNFIFIDEENFVFIKFNLISKVRNIGSLIIYQSILCKNKCELFIYWVYLINKIVDAIIDVYAIIEVSLNSMLIN